jgi:hypothetical protein
VHPAQQVAAAANPVHSDRVVPIHPKAPVAAQAAQPAAAVAQLAQPAKAGPAHPNEEHAVKPAPVTHVAHIGIEVQAAVAHAAISGKKHSPFLFLTKSWSRSILMSSISILNAEALATSAHLFFFEFLKDFLILLNILGFLTTGKIFIFNLWFLVLY